MSDIHSCSYYCDRPECIKAQRDELRDRLAQPEQEPVAWPCVIAEADFEQNTITVEMQCSDYKVAAGQHWLYTAPPQRKPLTDDECDAIYTALDAWAKEVDSYDFGLPTLAGGGMRAGRAIIRAAHGIKES